MIKPILLGYRKRPFPLRSEASPRSGAPARPGGRRGCVLVVLVVTAGTESTVLAISLEPELTTETGFWQRAAKIACSSKGVRY
jgi:hypothetical protein